MKISLIKYFDSFRTCAKYAALFFALCIMPSFASFAQSDPLYTLNWALPTLYNPATVGSTDYLRIRGGARMQWLGIHNAPKSFSGAADIPFKLLNRRWGGGVNVTQEGIGLFSNTYVNGQISARLKKLFGGDLTIGVQVGYFGSSFRGSDVYIPDEDDYHESNDPAIPNQDVGGGSIDFGVGLYYSHPKFHVGVSMLHPSAPKVKLNTKGTTSSTATSDNHEYETYVNRVLYLTAGSNIPIKNTLIELQPDLIVASDLKDLSAVASLKGWYNKFFFGGFAYRWNEAVSINIGAEFTNFILRYEYYIPTTRNLKAS
ncbi:MAG: PorP/SprF family type IX secretion system membrane protein, partial [Muribaculaceae bacterium]|nr:PorP/SprF family type IX secretion system membrane protein [Muribaculaceae bacterium]